jgi:hypothetical protein
MEQNRNDLCKLVIDAAGHLSILDAHEIQPVDCRQIGATGTRDECLALLEDVLTGGGSHMLAPGNELQSTIADAWYRVLGEHRIGIHDNFFEAGGTSLALQAVGMEIGRALHRTVPEIDLFRYPTIASLAAHLASTGPQRAVIGTSASERAAKQRGALHDRLSARGSD